MQKYRKPIINEEDLGINPCTIPLQIPIVRWVSKSFQVDLDGDVLNDVYDIEIDKHVKLYQTSERRKLVMQISNSSNKLLTWIMYELTTNKDWIWVNKKRFMEETGMSYNTYKLSITELHKYNLIQPTIQQDVYWINPHFFFPGNRVKKYPKNIIIKQDRTDE